MKKLLLLSTFFLFHFVGMQAQNSYFMCSAPVIVDANGILYDSGGPNDIYQVDEDCTTMVAPPNTGALTLNINFFDTELNYDFLYIYDGTNTNAPMVFNQSGSINPTQVVCLSGSALIVWHSDFTIIDSGFAISWNSFACPCDTISGITYHDVNNNCTMDAGEEQQNVSVILDNGSGLVAGTTSDANGFYQVYVPSYYTYNMQVNAGTGYNGRFMPSCPPSGNLQGITAPSANNDFGLVCQSGFDFTGDVTGWQFRPGFVATVCVFVYNHRCLQPTGNVELILSPNLTPLPDTNGIGYTINGQVVTFPLSTTAYDWSFCFPVLVSTSSAIGDSACVQMNINPLVGDSNYTDNTGSYCFPIRNSWDPNDKYVTPEGQGIPGFILPNTHLTFTVRFQNTGNAEAINIYILDTLDSDLDISTFELVGFSHHLTWSLFPGGILRFDFNNINLPDSNTSEPLSHGYFKYRIYPKSNIAHRTEIRNSASIYFDFNPPIFTNQTLQTIDYTLGVNNISKKTEFELYPNPAYGVCNLIFENNNLRHFEIRDIMGKLVYEKTTTEQRQVINTKGLSKGLYFLKIIENGNVTTRKFLVSN